MTNSAQPELSVVVVILGGLACLPDCLRALEKQVGAPPFEVIVPYDDSRRYAAALRRLFPWVEFVRLGGRRTYAELRAQGARRARGRIVALTEDHCQPSDRWCAEILRAHESSDAAIGGPVDKEGSDTVLNWAIYLNDFSRYMSPVAPGPAAYLTDCNVTYKRAALDSISALWCEEFHETTVNWTLLDRGASLRLCPELGVRQRRRLRPLAALEERFTFGRLFASTRVSASGPARRLMYTALALALPPVLVGRVVRDVLRRGRHRRQCLRALPWLAVLTTTWAAGEFAGYCTGTSGAAVAAERLSRSVP